jgi:DnaJ homolog subfamily A member 2
VKKGKAVLKKLDVKLEDVYSGKLFKLKHDRQQLCSGCDGKGGANQKKCAGCKGQGVVVKMQMIGISLIIIN